VLLPYVQYDQVPTATSVNGAVRPPALWSVSMSVAGVITDRCRVHAPLHKLPWSWRSMPPGQPLSRAARGPGGTPLRNWVHKKIPDCAVELNTQNCASFSSQISLITAMGFREAMPPRTTHQGLCPWTPLGDFRSPADPLCPHLQILAAPLQALHRHSTGRGDCGNFCMGLPLLHAWLP